MYCPNGHIYTSNSEVSSEVQKLRIDRERTYWWILEFSKRTQRNNSACKWMNFNQSIQTEAVMAILPACYHVLNVCCLLPPQSLSL